MKLSNKNGQTIVEAMIALGILTTGFLGIMALLTKSFFLNRVTSDELTATYLASEGTEVMKNILDHDIYVLGNTWGTCGGVCTNDGTYIADYTTGAPGQDQSLTAIAACPGPYLHIDPTTNLYNYTGSATTNFQRCLRITHTVSAGTIIEVTVNSIINWNTGTFTPQGLNIEDHFYNWHP